MVTQAEVDRLRWFHDFDFPGGLKARSAERDFAVPRTLLTWFVSEQLRSVGLAGKTVVDVGCWDGYFSFLAEERGARSVLAVDDASQNWGSPDCFRLAHTLKQSRVRYRPDVSVYELSQQVREQFDVVFFFGVYYHLHAPYVGFAQLRALCHDDSIVVVEGECLRDDERSYAAFDLDDPRTPSFTPTTRLLVELLRSCYFEVERMAFANDVDTTKLLGLVPPDEVLRLVARRLRIRRSARGRPLGGPAVATPPTPERVVIFARPIRGRNRHHQYRPPFGLERFDVPGRFETD